MGGAEATPKEGAAGGLLPLLLLMLVASCRNPPPPQEPRPMDKPATVRAHLFVKGRVQGVGFRGSTVEEALRIGGLTGWVRNLDDGRVEAVVEGARDRVDALIRWAHKGPVSARVDHVVATWEAATGEFPSFSID